ncbi:putative vacuolar protein sorting-associated protein TDA6 [Golovinomyces cichoracearum]|uniref:Putative vacuolar protein sorting-associated protein TDA6 n=1 Tax=Golovinomyces cichoracearum TaxID=62708 RepID=A0A420HEK7_9PEZI|nr:putative vacuolar protein sorting-associated protein TDA6 [Golovinomyces cichoracearum]
MSTKTEQYEEDAETALEEISMDDLEETAFLTDGTKPRRKSKQKYSCNRFIPSKLERVVAAAGTLKLVIICASVFIFALALLAYLNKENNILPETLPENAVELAQQVVEKLKDTKIPSFVLTYAPIVILDRKETYFPSDLSTHIQNTQPKFNFTPISNPPSPLNLSNLDQLNAFKDGDVYLSSREPIISLPKWLRGRKPTKRTLHTKRAVNCVIVVVEKEDREQQSVVDAFYLYFYSFNDGPRGLGRQLGNHIGDWEHNMIRFINGTPTAIWFSQHGFGAAYTYGAVQKIGIRPAVFSARGSHSNWPEAMAHDFHTINSRIPSHLAYDYTSLGRLWDPTLSAYFYTYNGTNTTSKTSPPTPLKTPLQQIGVFSPALSSYPTGFLYFNGQWGNQQLPADSEGQEEFHGFFKWSSGPKGVGWGDKVMIRDTVCPIAFETEGPGLENNESIKLRECHVRESI